MANVSYPQFNLKTIVLPIPGKAMTIEEYKNLSGIDIRDFVFIDSDDGSIYLDAVASINVLFLISDIFGMTSGDVELNVIVKADSSHWVRGTTNGSLLLKSLYNSNEGDYEGLEFFIDKDSDFTLDSLKIKAHVL